MPEVSEPIEEPKQQKYPLETEREPITTHHRLGDLEYTATVGMLPLKNEFGETEAGVFYMAYSKNGVEDPRQRPLMFSFNGGPGSSSVWLHLGAVGPRRVKLNADGSMPEPPFELEENLQSWLEHTDLVFIDPVGTGYSRPAKQDGGQKYWNLEGDVESVGEFIRLFISRNARWSSPLYLVGESYGTTRASALAGMLIDKGIAFKGIVLVSSILNFQTARFMKGNDLPYPLFLPTYAATAWYHGAISRKRTLSAVLKEAEAFAAGPYMAALAKGDQLPARERKLVIQKLSSLTGLSPEYIDLADLRIQIHRFCKELLRRQRRTVGRLDSRFKGIDATPVTEVSDYDPASAVLTPPYTSMINDYLRRELKWETDVPYYVSNPGELWKAWKYHDASQGYPDTSDALRKAMSKNPYMKVFIASGYFDLATPYFATEYTLAHMGLDPSVRSNISTGTYEAGHMMYIEESSLAKLKQDIARFMNN